MLIGLNQRLSASNKALLAQRQIDLKKQELGPTVDQLSLLKESEAQVEEQRATAETNFDYLDPIFEKALEGKPPVVAVNPEVKASDKAPAVRSRIDKLTADVEQAKRDEQQARGLKEYAAATEAANRRDAALKELEALSVRGDAYAQTLIPLRQKQDETLAQLDETAQRLKADETLGSDEQGKMASATRESLAARAQNLRAQFISSALEEAALHRRAAGKPSLTQDEAIKAASKLYDTVNDWVERASVQRPREELTDAQKNLEPTRQKVQRNGNTVSTYKVYDPETQEPVELTIIRQKGGNVFRVFSRYPDGGGSEFDNSYGKGMTDKDIVQKSFIDTELFTLGTEATPQISPAEAKHFKARIEAVRNQLSNAESTAARETVPMKEQFVTPKEGEAAPAAGPQTSGASPLRTQFAATEAKKVAEAKGETATTLAGELRRHSEYTLTNLAKAMMRDLPQGGIYEGVSRGQPFVYRVEDMRELLEKARDVIEDGKASRELLDAVDAQVERILRGEDTGNMLVKARKVVSEKPVVENVPGKEGQTRTGVKRKFGDVAFEEERAPLSEYQQDIKDALAAAVPTATEQKEAGQKALFPTLDKELGYIRANAKNFENSPAVLKARMALDSLKKFQAAEEKRKEAAAKAETDKREQRINDLEEQIDEAKGDYAMAFREALSEAIRTAKDARDAVLDPLIAKTQKKSTKPPKVWSKR